MGWITKKVAAWEMSDDFDALFEELTQRKYWKEISPDVIKRIFNNAKGDVGAIKGFVYISELHDTVRNNFVKLAKDEMSAEKTLSLFALTLYRLGSTIFKAGFSEKDDKQLELCVTTADMAFISSILCDPFELCSYAGMAFLYSSYFVNEEAALEWCAKYKETEDKLLNTPNDELNGYQLSEKKLLDPKEAARTSRVMADHSPHLIPEGYEPDGQSAREKINELEKKINIALRKGETETGS